LLYILTPIFCVALCVGAVFSFLKTDSKVYAATGPAPASILSLNGEFASKLQGAQNENIYFGTNGGSSVKWRVLSTGADNKYSSGNMLLWADKSVASEAYNSGPNQSTSAQPNYAYWSTSKIRASLNGGHYPNNVTGTNMPNAGSGGTISADDSWYGKLFPSADEKASVVPAGSYNTDNWGLDISQSQYEFKTNNITVAGYNGNGKYNQSVLGTGTAASAVKTSANGVQETSVGDKLFLLDYYDINNTALGFGDGALTYAKKIDSTWTESSGYYPGYFTGNKSVFNNITSDYLKFTDISTSSNYWLRPAGRNNASYSQTLIVDSTGYIKNNNVSYSSGVRPAFNFNASNVVYATAANLTSMGSMLSLVNTAATTEDGKPAYKVYSKGGSYEASTNSAKSYMAVNDRTITIAYNNPANIEDGNLILLLSNSDGSVAYQAEQLVSGVVSGFNTVTFTLPADVNYSDYTTTLLYTSANGGVSSETVYCAYTLNSGVDIPAVFNTEYKNSNQWIGSLDSAKRPNWYNEKLHGNESFVTVKSITYTDNVGNYSNSEIYNSATSSAFPEMKEAGTYKVTLALADGLKWSTGDSNDKTFNIVIAKAQPDVEVQTTGTLPTYAPDTLEEIGIELKAGGTPGTVSWKAGQLPTAGENVPYTWVFTPTVPNNYEGKEDTLPLTFKAREIDKVEAVFTPNGDIFTNTTEATLRDCTVVTITYKGTPVKTETTTNYEFLIDNDGVDELVEGDNYFKVRVTDEAAGSKKVSSALVKIAGVKKLGYSTIDSLTFSGKTFTYPVTADDIIGVIKSATLIRNDGHSIDVTDAEEIKKIIVLTDDCDFNAGTSKSFKFKISGADEEKTYGGFTINQGTLTPTVTFEGLTVTYDGTAKSLTATVEGLPEGLTLTPAYTVTGSATAYVADGYANAGTYNYTVSFTHTNPNYAQYTATAEATLQIDKASYTMPTGYDETKQVTYTGSAISLPANWITGLDSDVTVTYCEADGTTPFADKTAVGKYTVKAVFSVADSANYEVPETVTLTFEITDKKIYTPSVTFEDDTFTYDGQSHSIAIDGEVDSWITVKYYKADGVTEFTGATEVADSGTVIARFTHSDPEYADIPDMTATITINPADYD
ncbi:MAG: hypothetical protein K2G26_05985, partial [Clostridia bacterium]|nr:hypothetical protein [Clostridia bacterium]